MSGHKVGYCSGRCIIASYTESDVANVEDLACRKLFELLLLSKGEVNDKAVRSYGLIKMLVFGRAAVVGVTLENEFSGLGSSGTVLVETVAYTANHKGTRVCCCSGSLGPVSIVVYDAFLERSKRGARKIEDELIVIDLTLKVYLKCMRIVSVDADVIDGAVAELSLTSVLYIVEKASSLAVEACVKNSLPGNTTSSAETTDPSDQQLFSLRVIIM